MKIGMTILGRFGFALPGASALAFPASALGVLVLMLVFGFQVDARLGNHTPGRARKLEEGLRRKQLLLGRLERRLLARRPGGVFEADDIGARRLEFEADARALNRHVNGAAPMLMGPELPLLRRRRADAEAPGQRLGEGEGRSQAKNAAHTVLPQVLPPAGPWPRLGAGHPCWPTRDEAPAHEARAPTRKVLRCYNVAIRPRPGGSRERDPPFGDRDCPNAFLEI